ncbi:MAG: hypothetical protein QG588_785 [Candidatus Poribacteria bacterium]|nr:hypothetical protein [Candidatus Poribacteria bacterium]
MTKAELDKKMQEDDLVEVVGSFEDANYKYIATASRTKYFGVIVYKIEKE